MSRLSTPDTVEVKPTNNIYTVLVIVATLAAILGLVVISMKAESLFGEKLLF